MATASSQLWWATGTSAPLYLSLYLLIYLSGYLRHILNHLSLSPRCLPEKLSSQCVSLLLFWAPGSTADAAWRHAVFDGYLRACSLHDSISHSYHNGEWSLLINEERQFWHCLWRRDIYIYKHSKILRCCSVKHWPVQTSQVTCWDILTWDIPYSRIACLKIMQTFMRVSWSSCGFQKETGPLHTPPTQWFWF